MTILRCYVDNDTLAILRKISEQTGRTVEELAEAAIANEAAMSQKPRSPTL